MDIRQNFGIDPVDTDSKGKLSKKARKVLRTQKFGWVGFSEANNHLITWSTTFAPNKTSRTANILIHAPNTTRDAVQDIATFSQFDSKSRRRR
jgi:hypothetical protein